MNVKITVEYDGNDFYGWQTQPGLRTVQGEIVRVLSILAGQEVLIEGSGRTDGGVHALGQVASFDWPGPIPIDNLLRVLNHRLPEDIFVNSLDVMPKAFHARYSSIGKCYSYKLYKSKMRDPFKRRYALKVPETINVEAMRKGAEHLIGKHDFKAFMASGSFVTDTVRIIYRIDIDETVDSIELKFYGNGFLYNMVRILTAMLIDIGIGKKKPEDVPKIIQEQDRTRVPGTAVAQGLYLMQVYYEEEELEAIFETAKGKYYRPTQKAFKRVQKYL